jgi:hypothetical protein
MARTSLVLHSLILSSLMRHHLSGGFFFLRNREGSGVVGLVVVLFRLTFEPPSGGIERLSPEMRGLLLPFGTEVGGLEDEAVVVDLDGWADAAPEDGLVEGSDREAEEREGEDSFGEGEILTGLGASGVFFIAPSRGLGTVDGFSLAARLDRAYALQRSGVEKGGYMWFLRNDS